MLRYARTGTALFTVIALASAATTALAIPATPVMTVYQFNGAIDVPYYDADLFLRAGPVAPIGTLAQGTSVIPCLVLRAGRPLTDDDGTPFVGFEIVVDARAPGPDAATRLRAVAAQRQQLEVADHHCPADTAAVIGVRKLSKLSGAPRFDPPPPAAGAFAAAPTGSALDGIVRAFHASPQCAAANGALLGRRAALQRAWSVFAAAHANTWSTSALAQARRLDYAMRTALFEGHLGRGCNAYGACERNVIALSIRNRAVERCLRGQGCGEVGDIEGVASAVAQYNIWDEYLTQTSGLTGCFLRPDLAGQERYATLQAMYAQSAGDIERILFGGDAGLRAVFPANAPAELTRLRHYYHPPAMGQCFPAQARLEYISGAIAQRGDHFALIANTRIRVDAKVGRDYRFRQALVELEPSRDVLRLADRYPGFVIDGRKVELKPATRCTPYGVAPACRFADVGRYRKTPSWLSDGDPLPITCRVRARGESCAGDASLETVTVGGACDVAMQLIAGVP
ncbi:MAG: hypothetical protein ABI629_09315 [bacterium]